MGLQSLTGAHLQTYGDEMNRLATFRSWPMTSTACPSSLARLGFYCSGEGDKVKCFLCKLMLDNWTADDDPEEKHRRRSPDCAMAREVAEAGNVPLKILESGRFEKLAVDNVPRVSESNASLALFEASNQADEAVETKRLLSIYQQAINRANRTGLFTQSSSSIDRTNPDFDRLRSESSTFHDWPPSAHAQPAELAGDGFFFTGSDDRVQCAFCHGFLRNWVSGDRPSEEHKKHFPECPFVCGLGAGNIQTTSTSVSSSCLEKQCDLLKMIV